MQKCGINRNLLTVFEAPLLSKRVPHRESLFCSYLGLFYSYLGLFYSDIGLFCSGIGLFYSCIGLCYSYAGLFHSTNLLPPEGLGFRV